MEIWNAQTKLYNAMSNARVERLVIILNDNFNTLCEIYYKSKSSLILL